MYQPNTNSLIKKGLLTSALIAAASFLCTVPASACTGAFAPRLQATSPLATPLASNPSSATSPASLPDPASKSAGFVGLWDVKFISNGQVVDEGFETFHSDGTEILVDNSAPATDNVCIGIWEQTDNSTIKLKHPSWYFDLNGNLLGTVVIHETLTLDPGGDSFHGISIDDVYDTSGNKLGEYQAQVTAKRIKVD